MSGGYPGAPRWRRRLVRAAASRAHGALDNLHVALCKLAERARKADGAFMAARLVAAAQHLDMCLVELSALEREANVREKAEIMEQRRKRRDFMEGRTDLRGDALPVAESRIK